jgi:UDP-N-acetylmuramoylalanine--D-glutamate ligase
MKFADLRDKSILILGLGREGGSSFNCLRALFPEKLIGLADQMEVGQLGEPLRESVRTDPHVQLHLGEKYLANLSDYEVIIKSPGIPPTLPAIRQAVAAGKFLTSQTALFLANCPATIVGVTGTKGKSTTASLIHNILLAGRRETHLVGNIGQPPLALLSVACSETIFVCELSSYQLDGLRQSPQIAVLLDIVPEHLDYHGGFANYVEAKRNITCHQSVRDCVVYDVASEIPRRLAEDSQAQRRPFSLREPLTAGCVVAGQNIVYRSPEGPQETIVSVSDIPLLGAFNLPNVLAAVTVGKLLGITTDAIADGIRHFHPLAHRLECIGTYQGITFYDAAIATVPQTTQAHLAALGPRVQTVLLGGYDRSLDFTELGACLVTGQVRTLILFPTTGRRIWEAVCQQQRAASALPQAFFVQDMAEAVRLAYLHTEPGQICLLSPASPSFGLFRDYQERGESFKFHVRRLAGDREPVTCREEK